MICVSWALFARVHRVLCEWWSCWGWQLPENDKADVCNSTTIYVVQSWLSRTSRSTPPVCFLFCGTGVGQGICAFIGEPSGSFIFLCTVLSEFAVWIVEQTETSLLSLYVTLTIADPSYESSFWLFCETFVFVWLFHMDVVACAGVSWLYKGHQNVLGFGHVERECVFCWW